MHRDGPQQSSSAGFPHSSESSRGAPSNPQVPAVQIHEWTQQSGSTNDRLAALLDAGEDIPDFAVVGTDHQTSGRGRLDRTWSVPAGKALTCSVPVRVPAGTDSEALGWLPVATGLAVRAALAEAGVASALKWPNDVLVDGRKICGILARVVPASGGMAVVIGTGINVSLTAEDFRAGGVPEDAATSILLESGDTDRDRLLASLVTHLRERVGRVFSGVEGRAALAAEARAAMVTLGAHVRVHLPGDRQLVGTALDLDDAANLVVRPEGAAGHETVSVSAGDVVHVRPA